MALDSESEENVFSWESTQRHQGIGKSIPVVSVAPGPGPSGANARPISTTMPSDWKRKSRPLMKDIVRRLRSLLQAHVLSGLCSGNRSSLASDSELTAPVLLYYKFPEYNFRNLADSYRPDNCSDRGVVNDVRSGAKHLLKSCGEPCARRRGNAI